MDSVLRKNNGATESVDQEENTARQFPRQSFKPHALVIMIIRILLFLVLFGCNDRIATVYLQRRRNHFSMSVAAANVLLGVQRNAKRFQVVGSRWHLNEYERSERPTDAAPKAKNKTAPDEQNKERNSLRGHGKRLRGPQKQQPCIPGRGEGPKMGRLYGARNHCSFVRLRQ